MKRILQVSVLVLALIGLGGARATSLADLLAGGSITAGDKVFDQFTLQSLVSSDGHILDAANIDVTPLNDGGNDPGPGLAYAISNGELTRTGDGLFSFIDLAFGFRVTAPAGLLVHDNSMDLTGFALTTTLPDFEDLGMTILEWVDPTGFVTDPSTPGFISVEASDLAGVLTNKSPDSSTFAPHQSVFVTNDILVWATNTAETAALNTFEQRFSQQSAAIPEPGTLALLMVAMAGLGAGLRRRNA